MDVRRLQSAVMAATMILVCAASCAQPSSVLPEAPAVTSDRGSTALLEETPAQEPAGTSVPPNYDVDIYGDLEDLDPSGQTVIYWYQHSGPREELILGMVDEFNRTNEWGITVQGEYQGDFDDLHQKILAGVPSHRLPSVAMAHADRAATYAVQGALIPLDPYIGSENWGYTEEELGDFFPVALAADYLPQLDARYGFPTFKSMEVLYYNEDWLTELGFDGPPQTWDEFAAMACAAAQQPFSRVTGEGGSRGYVYSVSAFRFATFVFSRGGEMVNEDGTRYVFNGPEGPAVLTFLRDLVDHDCAAEQTERYGEQSEFAAGRALFTIASSSGLPFYARAVSEGTDFNWSVSPPPHTTGEPRMNIYGAGQSIFVSSPEEQLAAWLFVKWMSEPEQQAQWASGTSYFAVRRSAADLLADYLAQNPAYEKAFGFMSLDFSIEPPVAGYDECRRAIAEMATAVLGGEDAQAWLDATTVRCNAYLDEAAP